MTIKLDIINEYNMLPRGSRVLCAVSGGADSMCLLHLLHTRRQALGIEVLAAHYEHGLRGDASLSDARFVADWCAQHGIELRLTHGDVGEYACETGMGTEEAARTLRYAFLEETARELSCARIATAHNADDNAETVLFNLTRGTGSAGLGGIPPVRGIIVRPLLRTARAEIEQYLADNDIPHVEDASNDSDDYSRNLIRHRVTPALREINPACAANIGRASALLRVDEDCLGGLARTFIDRYFDGESVPAAELAKLHRAVSSRVVRALCKENIGESHVDAVIRIAQGTELAYADVPGARVRCERGRLFFAPEDRVEIPERALVCGGITDIPEAGLRLRADVTVYQKEINGLFKTYYFKCDNICGNIFCTGRRPGDSLRPVGRGCRKTLKSLFAEKRMTKRERDAALILRDDAGALAVCGIGVDERTVPAEGDRVIRIERENLDLGDNRQ